MVIVVTPLRAYHILVYEPQFLPSVVAERLSNLNCRGSSQLIKTRIPGSSCPVEDKLVEEIIQADQ